MITFISDLDNTLVYSKQNQGICVERKDAKEISYMTEKAYKDFQKLRSEPEFCFIPCTARSLEQTMRITFLKEQQPVYMICDNGASIYIKGKLDEEWNAHLKERGIIHPKLLRQEFSYVKKLCDEENICYRNIKNNQDAFFVISFDTESSASKVFNILKEKLSEKEFRLIQQHRKIYYCPIQLNKMLAVQYLLKKYDLGYVITSGDSMFDKCFTALGNSIFLPTHATFSHLKAIRTMECGMLAGEEIITFLEELAEKNT